MQSVIEQYKKSKEEHRQPTNPHSEVKVFLQQLVLNFHATSPGFSWFGVFTCALTASHYSTSFHLNWRKDSQKRQNHKYPNVFQYTKNVAEHLIQ